MEHVQGRSNGTGKPAADEPVGLRPACAADLPALARIAARSLVEPWGEASLAEELAREKTSALVAVRTGRPIGFVLGWLVAGEAQVLAVAVSPDERRAGVGRALLSAYIRDMRESGATRLLLEVRAGNHAARRLYDGLGLAQEGRRAGYYGNGEDALLYGCEL